jgi:hypothetical protein
MTNLAAFKLRPLTLWRFLLLLVATLAVNAGTIIALAQGNATTAVTASGGMSGQAILTVSASVVALTQLLKWSKAVSDQRGPLAVLVLALFGVAFWGWATGDISRASAFGYFAGWITVATSAAGVYGFTRSGPEAITATSTPPTGAGASATTGN